MPFVPFCSPSARARPRAATEGVCGPLTPGKGRREKALGQNEGPAVGPAPDGRARWTLRDAEGVETRGSSTLVFKGPPRCEVSRASPRCDRLPRAAPPSSTQDLPGLPHTHCSPGTPRALPDLGLECGLEAPFLWPPAVQFEERPTSSRSRVQTHSAPSLVISGVVCPGAGPDLTHPTHNQPPSCGRPHTVNPHAGPHTSTLAFPPTASDHRAFFLKPALPSPPESIRSHRT